MTQQGCPRSPPVVDGLALEDVAGARRGGDSVTTSAYPPVTRRRVSSVRRAPSTMVSWSLISFVRPFASGGVMVPTWRSAMTVKSLATTASK